MYRVPDAVHVRRFPWVSFWLLPVDTLVVHDKKQYGVVCTSFLISKK